MEEIKDIIEILELAKEEIENNNENITATYEQTIKTAIDEFEDVLED